MGVSAPEGVLVLGQDVNPGKELEQRLRDGQMASMAGRSKRVFPFGVRVQVRKGGRHPLHDVEVSVLAREPKRLVLHAVHVDVGMFFQEPLDRVQVSVLAQDPKTKVKSGVNLYALKRLEQPLRDAFVVPDARVPEGQVVVGVYVGVWKHLLNPLDQREAGVVASFLKGFFSVGARPIQRPGRGEIPPSAGILAGFVRRVGPGAELPGVMLPQPTQKVELVFSARDQKHVFLPHLGVKHKGGKELTGEKVARRLVGSDGREPGPEAARRVYVDNAKELQSAALCVRQVAVCAVLPAHQERTTKSASMPGLELGRLICQKRIRIGVGGLTQHAATFVFHRISSGCFLEGAQVLPLSTLSFRPS